MSQPITSRDSQTPLEAARKGSGTQGPVQSADTEKWDSHYRITLIPNKPNHPDGNSVWITTTEHKNHYLKGSGVPRPLKRLGRSKIEVRETSNGMGLGVFAKEDIKRFEPILLERPLLVASREIRVDPAHHKSLAGPRNGPAYYQAYAEATREHERMLEFAVNTRMNEKDRVAYKSLANSHREDGSGPMLGVVRTNGFGARFDDPVLDGVHIYTATQNIGSRFNHSCSPDVVQEFRPNSFAMLFQAVRDIKAGSQIFLSYLGNDALIKAERQQELKPYGMVCKCRACANHTFESDMLRKFIRPWVEFWVDQSREVWPKMRNPSLNLLIPIDATIKRMEEEGLEALEASVDLRVAKGVVYGLLGMQKESQELMEFLMGSWSIRGPANDL